MSSKVNSLFLGITTRSTGRAKAALLSLKTSRIHLFVLFLVTESPTFFVTIRPSLILSDSMKLKTSSLVLKTLPALFNRK